MENSNDARCKKILNITSEIQRCTSTVVIGTSRCVDHFYNKICPICLEDRTPGPIIKEDQFLVCNHWLHRVCCMGLNEMTCPLCKATITNFDAELSSVIEQNKKKRITETVLNESHEQAREIINRYIMTEIPDGEVLSAFRFMVNEGFPLSVLPCNIILTIDPDMFYERGYILQSVAVAMMRYILKNVLDDKEPEEETPEESAEKLDIQELFERQTIEVSIETKPSLRCLTSNLISRSQSEIDEFVNQPSYKRLFYTHKYKIENR